MSKFKPCSWKAMISKCPHCDIPISVEGQSNLYKKSAIHIAIIKAQDHVKYKCPLRMQIKSKKLTTLSIMTSSKNKNSTMTEWETDKVLV